MPSHSLFADTGFSQLLSYASAPHVWVMKDPRLCLTLPVWFPFMEKPPALVWTYRHPLEVMLSLEERVDYNFGFTRGLEMWLAYTKSAVKAAAGMCVVRTR